MTRRTFLTAIAAAPAAAEAASTTERDSPSALLVLTRSGFWLPFREIGAADLDVSKALAEFRGGHLHHIEWRDAESDNGYMPDDLRSYDT